MKKGKHFEDIACQYLTSLGYKILFRNFHCRYGEIDIVALEGDVFVFVEVKGTRTNFEPGERIDKRKLANLYKCIEKFLKEYPARECRVDAIIIKGNRIEHLKNISL
ncbi:YraN family protein [Thermocrinis sp.]